jgi:hypothetical protein
MLGIRIRRIRMLLGLPVPDPLVRGMETDPDSPYSQKIVEQTEIMLGKLNFNTKS